MDNRSEEKHVLARQEQWVAGMRLCYRLEADRGYCIVAKSRSGVARACLGDDFSFAWECFCRVTRGSVLPETLGDVCEDLLDLDARSAAL